MTFLTPHSWYVMCLSQNYNKSLNQSLDFACSEPNWVDEYPLHKYAYEGDANKLRELIRDGHQVNLKDRDSWSCVHYAAWYGHLDAIGVLLNEGKASPNIANDNGSTPLHIAAVNGHHYVVELLLNHPDIQVVSSCLGKSDTGL